MQLGSFTNLPYVNWRPTVDTAVDLPATDNQIGDAIVTRDTLVIYLWNGSAWIAVSGGGGSGTVESVGLADGSTTPIYSISGSPVTTVGTLTFSLNTQTAHTVFAGPSSGAAAQPSFRLLTASDIPSLGYVTAVTASSPLFSSGGTAPNITIQVANGSQNGYLSSTDWNTFNNKQSTLTLGNLTDAGTDGITITGGTGAVVGSGTSISQHVADTSHNGYLASADWNTFNGKQSTLTFSDSLVNTGGTVTLVNDTASPSSGQYYGTNGVGTLGFFTLPGSSGANTALSNLASVAINASLLPGSSNSIDLGSAAATWAHLYVGTQILSPLITGLGATGQAITLRGGLAAASGAGGQVTVTGAQGDSGGGNGGNATLSGGAAGGAGGSNESGGSVSITGGGSVGSATGGTVTVSSGTGGTGTGTAGATGGTTNINGGTGGAGSVTSGNGGGATLKGGSGGGGVGGGAGGTAQLTGGTGGTGSSTGGTGGAANLQGGSPGSVAGAAGGTITIAGGNGSGTGSGGAGGSVTINTGVAGGDNTANNAGGSFTLSVGHSAGSSSGANITMTAGTGGVGTSSTGAGGGTTTINAGAGGAGSATGGSGGNLVLVSGQGGSSGTPGTGGFIQFQTASTTSLTEKMRILAAGGVNIVNGSLNITTAGNGLSISHGSNCKLGTATLAAGTVTVSNTTVTANSVIFLTVQTLGTVSVPSAVGITAKSVGTSFTITSSVNTDTSTVAWMIVEQS